MAESVRRSKSISGNKTKPVPGRADQSLGDPAVVSALVRGFVSRVIALRAAWHETGVDPTQQIETMSRELGDIVLGRDARYVAQPFNKPHRLGVLIRFELKCSPTDPGYAFFDLMARRALKASIDLDGGADPAAVHAALDESVQVAIKFLLGRWQPAAWIDEDKAVLQA